MNCEICEKEFQIEQVGSGGRNRRSCYDCIPNGLDRAQRNRRRNQLLVEKARKQKENIGCCKCGYSKFGGALEWHHTDDNKEKHPSNALKRSWDAYLLEVNKCILVCANCHREIHNTPTI